jgi:hypothetical protein
MCCCGLLRDSLFVKTKLDQRPSDLAHNQGTAQAVTTEPKGAFFMPADA